MDTRQSLGSRARDRVRKDFTLETMVESTREIYDAVLNHGVQTLAELDRYLGERGLPPRVL